MVERFAPMRRAAVVDACADGSDRIAPPVTVPAAPGAPLPKRIWKIAKIALVCIVVLAVLAAGTAAFWVHRQLQPQDVTAARAPWPKAMTFEAADSPPRRVRPAEPATYRFVDPEPTPDHDLKPAGSVEGPKKERP